MLTGKSNLFWTRVKLYETFIGLLCSGWDLAKGIQGRARHKAEFKILVLRRLAFHTHIERKKIFHDVDDPNDITLIMEWNEAF